MGDREPGDSALTIRERFLASVHPDKGFRQLLNFLPGVLFFAKDRDGRLLEANLALLRLYGYQDSDTFWGVTDFDLLPRSLAEKFRKDDLMVMETGEPMLEIIEIFINPQGLPGWFLTNKLPIFSHRNEIIGVMGTIQNFEEVRPDLLPPDMDISPALRRVGSHFNRELSVVALAELCGLSVRQFERKFQQHLKTTPKQFIIKTRVYAACDLLRRTHQPIAEIATDLGFYDQAAFSRQFKKHLGLTPLQYRKQFR